MMTLKAVQTRAAHVEDEPEFKTMLKGAAAFKVDGQVVMYDRRSLYFLRGDNSVRQKIVQIVHAK